MTYIVKIPGIYKITNLVNKKIYIGSSINIIKRFSDHKVTCNAYKHKNIYLQNAWHKYGADNFKFEIIEVVWAEKYLKNKRILGKRLEELEQYWLDLFQPFIDNGKGYNIEKKAYCSSGVKRRPETILKIKESVQNRIKIGNHPCLNSGEQCSHSKLTWEKVKEMKDKYKTGLYDRTTLAKEYGITKHHFSEIMKGKYWNDGSGAIRKIGKTSDHLKFLEENKEEILEMIANKISGSKIAKHFNKDRHLVLKFIKGLKNEK